MSNDFIEIYDQALSPEFCQSFIETFNASAHLQPGRTGGGVDPTKKLSTDLYLNQHAEYQQQLKTIIEATERCALDYFKKYRFALIAPVALQVRHPQTGEPVTLTHENFDEVAAGNEAAFMQLLYRLGPIQAQKYDRGAGNYNYWHCEVFPRKVASRPCTAVCCLCSTSTMWKSEEAPIFITKIEAYNRARVGW